MENKKNRRVVSYTNMGKEKLFYINQEISIYNMVGTVKHIFNDTKKIVLFFNETKEEIQFDFEELEGC